MSIDKKVTPKTETQPLSNVEILIACGLKPSDSGLLKAINENYILTQVEEIGSSGKGTPKRTDEINKYGCLVLPDKNYKRSEQK